MRGSMTMISAMFVVSLMLIVPMAGMASADDVQDDPMDRIVLETGTTTEYDGGEYVAVNMTKGANLAWFGVVYGTEGSPAPITIVGASVKCLGTASVTDENGGLMSVELPIPIVTFSAQRLFNIFEFNDTGYADVNDTGYLDGQGRYGAGNGLFDFTGNRELSDFDMRSFEPVYRMVDLETAWTLSEIVETVDTVNMTKRYDFSLYAENLTYAWVADQDGLRAGTVEDGVVDRVEFAFHLTATATEGSAELPRYSVRIGDDNEILSSEQVGTTSVEGVHVGTDFKYDHIIQGWDYTARSDTTHLCLENGLMFATFVPDAVQAWVRAQLRDDGVGNQAQYTLHNGRSTVSDMAQLPQRSQRLHGNSIEFVDSWDRVSSLTWVSNVTVDGQEDSMYYQIHAGESGEVPGEDGSVWTMVILGGYIYPAGEDIYHDPALEVQSFMAPMDASIDAGFIVSAVIGAAVVCVLAVLCVVVVRRRNAKRYDYRMPPQGRR